MIDTSTIVTGLIAEGVEPEVAEEAVKQYVAKNTIKMKRLARKLRKQIKRDQEKAISSIGYTINTPVLETKVSMAEVDAVLHEMNQAVKERVKNIAQGNV